MGSESRIEGLQSERISTDKWDATERAPPSACVFVALVGLLTYAKVTLASEPTIPAPASRDEETLWKLERVYWQYVQDNDLAAYSNLWHKDFLGWPAVSAAPVHKDHITDWITSQTSKGLVFKAGEFRPSAIHVTGDVAMACYWITFR